MSRNLWFRLPRSRKLVFINRGAVSHASIVVGNRKVVQIPYRDNGDGELVVLSGRISFRDAQKLDRAGKIVWVDLDVARDLYEAV